MHDERKARCDRFAQKRGAVTVELLLHLALCYEYTVIAGTALTQARSFETQATVRIDSTSTGAGNEAALLLEHSGNNSYEIQGFKGTKLSSSALKMPYYSR